MMKLSYEIAFLITGAREITDHQWSPLTKGQARRSFDHFFLSVYISLSCRISHAMSFAWLHSDAIYSFCKHTRLKWFGSLLVWRSINMRVPFGTRRCHFGASESFWGKCIRFSTVGLPTTYRWGQLWLFYSHMTTPQYTDRNSPILYV